MSSYQYRKSHCGDKTVVRSSYLHNGISYTGKMTSLYWFSPLEVMKLQNINAYLIGRFMCVWIEKVPQPFFWVGVGVPGTLFGCSFRETYCLNRNQLRCSVKLIDINEQQWYMYINITLITCASSWWCSAYEHLFVNTSGIHKLNRACYSLCYLNCTLFCWWIWCEMLFSIMWYNAFCNL